MSEQDGSSQGLHYHYHFHGAGAGAGDGPGNSQGNAQANTQGGAAWTPPGMMPPAGAPYPFGPFFGSGPASPGGPAFGASGDAPQAGGNWHRHPGADSLMKGLAIGAGAAYLLTNETAQRTILRTAVQVWSLLQNGIEELKERLHDAEAEVAAAAEPEPEAPPAPAPAPTPAAEVPLAVPFSTVTGG